MSGVPILVEATSARVLIVGGGAVAVRKARLFAEAGALVRVVARQPTEEMRVLVLEHNMLIALRDYEANQVVAEQRDPVNEARKPWRGRRRLYLQ